MFILTQQQVDEYFNEWLQNINAAIASRNVDHNIENYPEVKNAFEAMKRAWLEAFLENNVPQYIEKARNRDNAIQELAKCIAEAGISYPAA